MTANHGQHDRVSAEVGHDGKNGAAESPQENVVNTDHEGTVPSMGRPILNSGKTVTVTVHKGGEAVRTQLLTLDCACIGRDCGWYGEAYPVSR